MIRLLAAARAGLRGITRPRSGTRGELRASDVRCTARIGARVCLPAALASLLVGTLPVPCPAAARLDVRDQIQSLFSSTSLTLHLMNGERVSGAFRGFVGDWSDSAQASVRYASWREAQPEALPAIGDTMLIEVAPGDTLRGSFKGVGATFLALDIGSISFDKPVPFTSIRAIHSPTGTPLAEWSVAQRYLQEAPNLIGVVLRVGTDDVMVTREAISTVTSAPVAAASSGISGGQVLVLVGLGALVGILICASALRSAENDLFSSCGSVTLPPTFLYGGFGASSVSKGLAPWAPGETRRP